MKLIWISKIFNDRRARAAHSVCQSLARALEQMMLDGRFTNLTGNDCFSLPQSRRSDDRI
jgi:hypothetical protein